MLTDVVVDTNVLMHAENPEDQFFKDAVEFLTVLEQADTLLCVDLGFTLDSRTNTSKIGSEYVRLPSGSLGFAIVSALAGSRRMRAVSTSVDRDTHRTIMRDVNRNPRDRTFVKVAFNSEDHVLVSHDFADFSLGVRSSLKRSVGVRIVTAGEAEPMLHKDSI